MSALDPTKEQWCWAELGEEHEHGPFDSKAEAISEASDELGEAGLDISIGRCMPFVPEEWARGITDLDRAREQVERFAGDNGWLIDEPLFSEKAGAEEALYEALEAWAREWLVGIAWRMDDNPVREKTIDLDVAACAPDLAGRP